MYAELNGMGRTWSSPTLKPIYCPIPTTWPSVLPPPPGVWGTLWQCVSGRDQEELGRAWVGELGEEVDLVFRKRGMGGGRAEEDRASPIDRSSHVGPGDLSAEAQTAWKPLEPARHALARPHAFWITCWHDLPS